ncbi:MAG: tRNA 2-selenouridine(34) synthase MnmH [Bacteroidales bacterium]|nr:tRNA 2-selenouridine(34) synthase MnmH [Bacteroidales bacterium]
MQNQLPPGEFLHEAKTRQVVDVRSGKEYAQGHIPGAINLPLFNDTEREILGKAYAHSGRDAAIIRGLELVGHKLPDFVKQARQAGNGGDLLLHCWRGGMRSEAMAWLFNFSGIRVSVLEGGYKAYRRYIREELSKGPPVFILAGMAGSGKTMILNKMAAMGVQVINLEKLAHHKGSAFGALGQDSQPTNEQFENDLASQWMALNPLEPAWIEDESPNIGKVVIPEPFFKKMSDATVVYLDVPFETRVGRLMREYCGFDKKQLEELIARISRRMGGDHAGHAINALEMDDLHQAVTDVLAYYDKTYRHSFEQKKQQTIRVVKINNEEEIQSVPDLLRTIR